MPTSTDRQYVFDDNLSIRYLSGQQTSILTAAQTSTDISPLANYSWIPENITASNPDPFERDQFLMLNTAPVYRIKGVTGQIDKYTVRCGVYNVKHHIIQYTEQRGFLYIFLDPEVKADYYSGCLSQ
jgi:hypothetical protein